MGRALDVLFDLDGTLVDLTTKWVYYFNNRHGTDYTRDDFLPGGRLKYGSLDERWVELLRIPGFHADLPWLDSDAPNALRRIRDVGHTILVATSPVAWESARDKYSWVHTHLRIPGLITGMDALYLCRDKTRIKADVLVDDRPEFFGGQEHSLIMDQPWNRAGPLPGVRARNMADIEEMLELIATEGEV